MMLKYAYSTRILHAASTISSIEEDIGSDITGSHVTIAAENSIRSAGTSRTTSNRVRPGWNIRLR